MLLDEKWCRGEGDLVSNQLDSLAVPAASTLLQQPPPPPIVSAGNNSLLSVPEEEALVMTREIQTSKPTVQIPADVRHVFIRLHTKHTVNDEDYKEVLRKAYSKV